MNQNKKDIEQAKITLHGFCQCLTAKLQDPSSAIQLQIAVVSEAITSFWSPASNQVRVRFAYWMTKQVRIFLNKYVDTKLKNMKGKINEPIQFIQQIGQIWQNFQRFIYALKFICNKADNTFKDFHKFSVKYESLLVDQQKKDNMAEKQFKSEICPIPVIGVNQLKQFMKAHGYLQNLTKKFVDHFCSFIRQQRDGLNVPREKVNEVLQFFQSMNLDFDCDSSRVADKVKIIKSVSTTAPGNRRSTANRYFDDTFMPQILKDCESYYNTWVNTKTIYITPSQQIKQILKFLSFEEDRAKYYIHDPKNQKKYIQTVQSSLIQYKFNERVQKPTGFRAFLQNFEIGNAQLKQQLLNFWSVYKRIYNKQQLFQKQKVIERIYENYLREQSTNVSQSIQKPPQFIEKCIALNKKNVQIINLLQKPIEMERKRVEIMQLLLALKYIDAKYQNKIKQHNGAKYWAGYLNTKFKAKYAKIEPFGQIQADLVMIFKLLIHRTIGLQQHWKLMCSRLIQQVDMSMVNQYSNALQIQSRLLEQIKKEAGQNQIKSIQNCVKDVKASYQERQKLKKFKTMSSFGFFNQVIKKSGNHWTDVLAYQIQPPLAIRQCIQVMRQYYKDKNFMFELQSGTSLFTGKFKQLHKFQFKNIYMMILLLIDQQKTKRMFYIDLTKSIQSIGVTDKNKNQFIRCLIELTVFGLLKTNKQIGTNCDIWDWSATHYFEINRTFEPQKKAPIYKTANLTALPEHIKKAFNMKLSTLQEEEKKIQEDRRQVVKSKCVQLLKHAQAVGGGKGTITFQQLLKGQKRQSKVTPGYLKQIMEHLINGGYCQRLQDKRNVFRYKS